MPWYFDMIYLVKDLIPNRMVKNKQLFMHPYNVEPLYDLELQISFLHPHSLAVHRMVREVQ